MQSDIRSRLSMPIALLLTFSVLALVGWRFWIAHQRGSTGVAFHGEISRGAAHSKINDIFGIGELRAGGIVAAQEGGSGARGGLRLTDTILSVNGIPISDDRSLLALDAELRKGDELTYGIERDGRRMAVRAVLVSPFSDVTILITMGLYLGTALAYMIISLLVLSRRPGSRRAIVFFLLCAAGGAFFLLLAFAQVEAKFDRGVLPAETAPLKGFFLAISFGIAAMLVETLLLHLTLLFPKERPIVRSIPTIFYWVHMLPLLPITLNVLFFASVSAVKHPLHHWIGIPASLILLAALGVHRHQQRGERWTRYLVLHPVRFALLLVLLAFWIPAAIRVLPRSLTLPIFFGLGLVTVAVTGIAIIGWTVLAIVNLMKSYRESGVEERDQIRWPLFGTITAVTISTIASFAGYLMMRAWPEMMSSTLAQTLLTLLTTASYILIPMTFAFAILKYRLLDIDFVIRRALSYSILTGVTIAIYIGFVFVLGNLLVNFLGAKNQAVIIVATLSAGILFIPLRNRIQNQIDRHFARQKHSYPEALRELLNAAQQDDDLGVFASRAVSIVQKALQIRSAGLFVRDQGRSAAELIASIGLPSNAAQIAIDPAKPAATAPFIHVVPIIVGEEANAFLAAGPPIGGGELEAEDVEFLREAASHCTIAIERLTKTLEQTEFQQALEIQQSLLPKELPRFAEIELAALWQPARTVAGDYYDVLVFNDRKFGVCIADVAGKGMPAAMLMSNLQAAVNAIADADLPPHSVCQKVARVVRTNLAGGKFVSFFYALFDLDAMTIRYCNAGHNPPLLLRSNGERLSLEKGGPVFARMMSGGTYTDQVVRLQDGDRLVLFTDGVTEARGENDEDFGEERLAEIVRSAPYGAREIRTAILEAIETFASGKLLDDVTLLVATVGPRS
jgi:serine phosphatase RsbU (regulator of sigma subunit)